MTQQSPQWQDQQIEQIIGNLLRWGVLVAAAFGLVGVILYLAHYGNVEPDYHVFRGEPQDLRSPLSVFLNLLRFQSRDLMQFGLLLLIATPIARVAFSVLAFWQQRDYLYVAITLLVLTILCLSLTGLV